MLKEFTRFQHEAEGTALWFVLDELEMYIACDRVEDTRWCGKWERSFKLNFFGNGANGALLLSLSCVSSVSSIRTAIRSPTCCTTILCDRGRCHCGTTGLLPVWYLVQVGGRLA